MKTFFQRSAAEQLELIERGAHRTTARDLRRRMTYVRKASSLLTGEELEFAKVLMLKLQHLLAEECATTVAERLPDNARRGHMRESV